MSTPMQASPLRAVPPPEDTRDGQVVVDRSIGHYIREAKKLTDGQIGQIIEYQRKNKLRFGEAAVALRLATGEDVLWALSQQFHYPYAPQGGKSFNPELVTAVDPFCDQAEAFRDIRSQLMMGIFAPEQPRRALAVLSPNSGDGKTFFAANTAVSLSQLGGRVLLVDADLRTPRQHTIFHVPNRGGLSSILVGRADADIIHAVPELPSLYVMPVGTVPPNPLELVQRPAFGLLVQELLAKFDHIIVDTPAAEHGADARVIAAKCGAALVIGRRGTSRMASMQSLVAQLSRGPAKVAGVMLNEH